MGPEKEGQIKSNISRRKDIKIKVEINEINIEKTIGR